MGMATLLWTGLYIVMLIESAFVLVLCLPLPSNAARGFILRSYRAIWHSSAYLRHMLVTLVVGQAVLFLDAMRTLNHLDDRKVPGDGAMHRLLDQNRLLRNQRNAYVTGFGVFMVLVCWRLLQLMDQLFVSREEAKRLAQHNGTVEPVAPVDKKTI
eukprot:TRINITY_DN69844_c0_g1_i1.p1 TRINITY_DN69844_c0_g1~~TRINITY_DN69844_c0_g1_i1.p1  ORF type:complete len:156 (+),score=28.46 TRINITY_DN69844_c0_g1_i1:44-511(+)